MSFTLRAAAGATIAITIVSCSRGDSRKPEDTAAAPASTVPSTPAASPSGTSSVGTAVTGKMWDVKMYGDQTGSRFVPAELTIKKGDGVRWTLVDGAPHNVAFWSDSIPSGAASVLSANMPQQMGELMGAVMTNPSQTYTVSFAGLPPGIYKYYCVPHLSLGMKGSIIVQ